MLIDGNNIPESQNQYSSFFFQPVKQSPMVGPRKTVKIDTLDELPASVTAGREEICTPPIPAKPELPPRLDFFPPPPPEFSEDPTESSGPVAIRNKLQLWETRSSNGKSVPAIPAKPKISFRPPPNERTPSDDSDAKGQTKMLHNKKPR